MTDAAPRIDIPGHTIVSLLGRGGMAEVFLARDESLGRLVAVKVIKLSLVEDPSFQRRFEREAQTAAGLSHPNIVPVHRFGLAADGRPYLTMAFLDGGSLRDRLAKGRTLAVEDALAVVRQIASALVAAHARNVVHRDIKPDNILFQGDIAFLTDFGIAKLLDATALTADKSMIGTLQYMAPEQLTRQSMDLRVDVHALGLVLYEMLTGLAAFDGDTESRLVLQVATEQPRPLPPELRGLQPFLDLLLAKDPAGRIQSCDDVLRIVRAMERNLTRHDSMERISEGIELTPPKRAAAPNPVPLPETVKRNPVQTSLAEPSEHGVDDKPAPVAAEAVAAVAAPVEQPPKRHTSRRAIAIGVVVAALAAGLLAALVGIDGADASLSPAHAEIYDVSTGERVAHDGGTFTWCDRCTLAFVAKDFVGQVSKSGSAFFAPDIELLPLALPTSLDVAYSEAPRAKRETALDPDAPRSMAQQAAITLWMSAEPNGEPLADAAMRQEAAARHRFLADHGDVMHAIVMSRASESGAFGLEIDAAAALRYAEAAAASGFPLAQYQLAHLLWVAGERDRSNEVLRLAAEAGFGPAQFSHSLTVDEPSSTDWLKRSAKQDYPPAQYRLAMRFNGRGDEACAVRLAAKFQRFQRAVGHSYPDTNLLLDIKAWGFENDSRHGGTPIDDATLAACLETPAPPG